MPRPARSLTWILYTSWCVFWFVLPFLLTWPLHLLLAQFRWGHRALHEFYRGWARFQFVLYGSPLQVRGNPHPHGPGQVAIYCANHSSYIDIPVLFAAIPGFANIVGKASLTKVPIWGRCFKRLYLTVDRRSALSRGRSFIESARSLKGGRDLILFPEGTISPTAGHKLLPLKDGAFRLAIEQQVPIVPVTMPYNHRFFPDLGGRIRLRYHPLVAIFHPPIATTGLTLNDLPALRQQVRDTIEAALEPDTESADAPQTTVPEIY